MESPPCQGGPGEVLCFIVKAKYTLPPSGTGAQDMAVLEFLAPDVSDSLEVLPIAHFLEVLGGGC